MSSFKFLQFLKKHVRIKKEYSSLLTDMNTVCYCNKSDYSYEF